MSKILIDEDAVKLALEALEAVTRELLTIRDELAERGGRPKTNVFHQRLWDSSHTAYTDKAIPAAIALREALAEQPAQRTWVGLTTKEIREWWASENGLEDCLMAKLDDFEQVARAIEAKLRSKNT